MQWNLLRIRKENGLTQKDVAALIGIHVDSYCSKENGKREFTADEMFALSSYFKLQLDQIFLPRKLGVTEYV